MDIYETSDNGSPNKNDDHIAIEQIIQNTSYINGTTFDDSSIFPLWPLIHNNDPLVGDKFRVGVKSTKKVCRPTCKCLKSKSKKNCVYYHSFTDAENDGYKPCHKCYAEQKSFVTPALVPRVVFKTLMSKKRLTLNEWADALQKKNKQTDVLLKKCDISVNEVKRVYKEKKPMKKKRSVNQASAVTANKNNSEFTTDIIQESSQTSCKSECVHFSNIDHDYNKLEHCFPPLIPQIYSHTMNNNELKMNESLYTESIDDIMDLELKSQTSTIVTGQIPTKHSYNYNTIESPEASWSNYNQSETNFQKFPINLQASDTSFQQNDNLYFWNKTSAFETDNHLDVDTFLQEILLDKEEYLENSTDS